MAERMPIEAVTLGERHLLRRLQGPALAGGLVGLLGVALGWWRQPDRVFPAYLLGFLFWFSIALGSLAVLMLQHVAGGRWGATIRRVLEASTRTLPLLALLFVPVLLGTAQLYEWARPEVVAHDPVLQHKRLYLNVPFFAVRAILYFGCWLILAWLLNRWSLEQDHNPSVSLQRKLENLSRGGLVLYVLTITFASIDWVMSLEPHWYSTIYGILFLGGQGLAAFAFTVPVIVALAGDDAARRIISPDRLQDLGKLMLAFVMLWAYFAFSQFLIIWSGNLPEETPWYLARLHGGWQVLAVGIIVFHFALPFGLLLSREVKRIGRTIAAVALVVLFMRAVDLAWMVLPAFFPGRLSIHWLDAAAWVGIGGLWFAAFVWQLSERPLFPLNAEAFAGEGRRQ